jgi:polysaccharide deacetylase 2 family uncharacterized protein YibQ
MGGSGEKQRDRRPGAWRGRLWPIVVLIAAALLIGLRLALPPGPRPTAPAERHAALPPPPAPADEDTAERLADEAFAAQLPRPERAPEPVPQGHAAPAWERYALPALPADGRPRIAIVVDDLGVDRPRTERTIALPAPLTLSFLAYAGDVARQVEAARRHGHELLVHVPMESVNGQDMGPNGLSTALTRDELLRRLRWDLTRFDGYVGINNHMGSRFTSDSRSMAPVIAELKARGLLFLDSRTTAATVGFSLARAEGVPTAARDVFLDNEASGPAIARQLREVEAVARRRGSAIAIGHPHDATLAALAPWLAGLAKRDLVLVPVSAIVRERGAEG